MTAKPVVCIFPHSDDEFSNTDDLRDFLTDELPSEERGGEYLLRQLGWKDKDFKARVVPDSLVLFRKRSVIVGDAVVKQPIIELIPPEEGIYYHKIVFEPKSIRVYRTDINISRIEAWAGRRVYARFYAIVGLREDYEKTFIPI